MCRNGLCGHFTPGFEPYGTHNPHPTEEQIATWKRGQRFDHGEAYIETKLAQMIAARDARLVELQAAAEAAEAQMEASEERRPYPFTGVPAGVE